MAEAKAEWRGAVERPLSPHLQIYKMSINMSMSIWHRITGGALYFGTLLLAWWLIGQWQATGMAIALLSTNLFSLAYFLWAADRKIRSQESESASLQL